jgi:tetratricopeptide (TPR) repeat protein
MLLRQLYMAYYEAKKFRKAYEVSAQILALHVLVDIAHQDAARACQALGKMDEAIGHLRLAARRGPVVRRAFHLWTLGSTLFLVERYREAAGCLERAAQWGTTDKALYTAHATLARLARGETVSNARVIFRRLSQSASGEGYGRFVLGMLAFHMKRWAQARTLLELFVERTVAGRPALGLSLAGEIALARSTLARMSSN